jgi:hypothetical protein
MTDLLSNKLVLLYFQPDVKALRANADLVVSGMQEYISVGERYLFVSYDGTVTEMVALTAIDGAMRFNLIRLPSKYQTDKVMVTCPTCRFTYEHQHVFAEGTK